jgi:hypothetical protein
MSVYEWEHGTLKLPSGVAPKMRKALAATQNKHFDDVMAEAKKFWATNKTTSKKKLHEAVLAEYDKYGPSRGFRFGPEMSKAKEDALSIFQTMTSLWNKDSKPHAPKVADVAAQVGPKATSRTTQFRAGYEASITFNGNKVTWDVPENNHAIDSARESIVGDQFFRLLDKVEWTRGTGGEIVGNDEYNEDNREAGGGANYVVAGGGYGPLGDPFWKNRQAAKKAAKPRSTGTHHVRSGTVTKKGVARTGTVAKNPNRKPK